MKVNKTLAVLPLMGTLFVSAISSAIAAEITVFVGYADNLRPSPYFPNPWDGSPNVIFLGQHGGEFDAGAIRLQNTGVNDVLLGSGAHVNGFRNGADFRLWDGYIGSGITIHPGQSLILTQTNVSENFDTSDQPILTEAQRTNDQPKIHVTLNNTEQLFVDTAQVLNTGGFDLALRNNTNESLQWRLIGTTGINDPGGFGVPEPGSLALLTGTAVFGTSLMLRRRRK